jgi:hypothetical protein
VINGIVVLVVVGGSVVVVVVVVVVVLVLVVVGRIVVVVVVVVVVAGTVVVVAVAPGPKVHPASRDRTVIVMTRLDDDLKRGVICRRASRSSVHPARFRWLFHVISLLRGFGSRVSRIVRPGASPGSRLFLCESPVTKLAGRKTDLGANVAALPSILG